MVTASDIFFALVSNCVWRNVIIGYQKSPRLAQMLIVFHGGSVPIFDVVSFQVQTEFSFAVASLSFFSAHVSVDPTGIVRVMLD